MPEVNITTRKVLGWTLAGLSAFHAILLLWGAATWNSRLEESLEDFYGDLATYLKDNSAFQGAPVEFAMCMLASLACIGWALVALHGYAPAFLENWKGRSALVGGGTMTIVYLAVAMIPLLFILNPRDFERIPSWHALGAGGDATFLGAFLIDAIAVAWWTLERAQQPERR